MRSVSEVVENIVYSVLTTEKLYRAMKQACLNCSVYIVHMVKAVEAYSYTDQDIVRCAVEA